MGIKVLKTLFVVIAVIIMVSPLALAGSLEPTAPPSSTMKTLDEVEARTPISSLPFTINAPGSYYLTENRTGPAFVNGIIIVTDSVTVDLNGFTLKGIPGSHNGIWVSGVRRNISVKNGTLSNWGWNGIDVRDSSNGILSDLRVDSNNQSGIYAGNNFLIQNCVSENNTNVGIRASTGNTVVDCIIGNNGTNGIMLTDNNTINNCTVYSNIAAGINVSTDNTISGCTSNFNLNFGIFAGSSNFISKCSAGSNGTDGIAIINFNSVINNNCSFNGTGVNPGAGINVSGGSNRVDGNTVTLNDFGIDVNNIGNIIIRNTARGNSSGNYSIPASNSYGPIVNVGGVGDISGTANANHPWANFEY